MRLVPRVYRQQLLLKERLSRIRFVNRAGALVEETPSSEVMNRLHAFASAA